MRWAVTVVSWAIAVAILAPVCFFAVLVVAGPHSSMLPSAIQPVVLVLGWILFLTAPVLVARAAWRRAGR